MSGEKKKFNKAEYDKEFHKENYKMFVTRFSKFSDKSIIEKLESVENKTDYIRQLILKDIEETKQSSNL